MDWNKFAGKVWPWQLRNFPAVRANPHWPLMGICEEAGELMHARLKMEQGIRGSPEEWAAKIKDALADISIFTMSACAVNDWDAQRVATGWEILTPLGDNAERIAIFRLYGHAGRISETLAQLESGQDFQVAPNAPEGGILYGFTSLVMMRVNALAELRGWDLGEITQETWERVVSKRDWQANPITGEKLNAPPSEE